MHTCVFSRYAFNGNTVFRAAVVADPLVYIVDSHLPEKVRSGLLGAGKNSFYGFRIHADPVIPYRYDQTGLSGSFSVQISADADFSCTALWFNSVEKSIFYERLQGKTVDQAVIEGFFRNFTFQRDTAAVTVLLDQK